MAARAADRLWAVADIVALVEAAEAPAKKRRPYEARLSAARSLTRTCPLLESVFLAVVAFASTNVDDAFVLLGFFSDTQIRAHDVIVGQYVGMFALVGLALVLSRVALTIPDHYIGFLGFLPLVIGAKQLWANLHEPSKPRDVVLAKTNIGASTLSVALVTIANGGDNIAVYIPLFAGRGSTDTLAICAVFVVMLAAWCFAAKWFLSHRRIGDSVRFWAHRAMPLLLMALGVSILMRSRVSL